MQRWGSASPAQIPILALHIDRSLAASFESSAATMSATCHSCCECRQLAAVCCERFVTRPLRCTASCDHCTALLRATTVLHCFVRPLPCDALLLPNSAFSSEQQCVPQFVRHHCGQHSGQHCGQHEGSMGRCAALLLCHSLRETNLQYNHG